MISIDYSYINIVICMRTVYADPVNMFDGGGVTHITWFDYGEPGKAHLSPSL